MKAHIYIIMIMIIASLGVSAVGDLDNPNPTVQKKGISINAPSYEDNTESGGVYTFTQRVDESSTAPHYTAPFNGGFEVYSWFDEDYGWAHTFPYFDQPGLQILSAELTIHAWDVDSEPSWGYDGEYDGIYGDGNFLNPQYLQGFNSDWSTTVFTINPGLLMDGQLDMFMDIDMHHFEDYWATTLDYSLMTIKYTLNGSGNHPPYQLELELVPSGCPSDDDGLVVNVVGPSPADPAGDGVTYKYRWLVDAGTGNYIDDEFAGRGDHTGNTVPAADTQNGDKWRVEVTPIDEHQAYGTSNVIDFPEIGDETCNIPPVAVAGNDQRVCFGTVTLDGSGSYDVDGEIVSYLWEIYDNGEWVEVGTGAVVDVELVDFGSYQFRLTVTDDEGAKDDAALFVYVDIAVCDDVGIPEFGVVAAGLAIVGAAGGFLILRRRQ